MNFTQNLHQTAFWAGNGRAVISADYLGSGTPEEAERYYSLNSQSGTVVAIGMSTNSAFVAENPNEMKSRVVVCLPCG